MAALAMACSREPTPNEALADWEEAFVEYAVVCATGEMPWQLRLRSLLTDGPVLICSGKSTPTVQDGKNATFAIRYARELGRPDVVEKATHRLTRLTAELRAGSRGWLTATTSPYPRIVEGLQ